MKTAPKLQELVTEIARKHGVDLTKAGAYLRLELAEHGHLVLEHIGAGRVSLTNYIPVGSDLVADPAVVLYADYRAQGQTEPLWVAMEITEIFGGWHLYAELDRQGNLLVHDPAEQAELANYCERELTGLLSRSGWLDVAVRSNQARPVWTREDILARDIRPDELADAGEEAEA
jgi:hypothetical protein